MLNFFVAPRNTPFGEVDLGVFAEQVNHVSAGVEPTEVVDCHCPTSVVICRLSAHASSFGRRFMRSRVLGGYALT
jgi:hypothetical protein